MDLCVDWFTDTLLSLAAKLHGRSGNVRERAENYHYLQQKGGKGRRGERNVTWLLCVCVCVCVQTDWIKTGFVCVLFLPSCLFVCLFVCFVTSQSDNQSFVSEMFVARQADLGTDKRKDVETYTWLHKKKKNDKLKEICPFSCPLTLLVSSIFSWRTTTNLISRMTSTRFPACVVRQTAETGWIKRQSGRLHNIYPLFIEHRFLADGVTLSVYLSS